MRFAPLALLVLAGCTERFLQVRSDPPGADVYVDGRKIGRTPCETKFTWYGDREIVLEKDGYASVTKLVEVRPPWWQWPGIDFFADVVSPVQYTDRRVFFFVLQPLRPDPALAEEIRRRAEELRTKAKEKP